MGPFDKTKGLKLTADAQKTSKEILCCDMLIKG